MFESTKNEQKNDPLIWNGNTQNIGPVCPSGTYFYVLKYAFYDNLVYQDHSDSGVSQYMVSIQTPAMGGGQIYFDDVLVRKDGLFVLPALEGLNPDQLK